MASSTRRAGSSTSTIARLLPDSVAQGGELCTSPTSLQERASAALPSLPRDNVCTHQTDGNHQLVSTTASPSLHLHAMNAMHTKRASARRLLAWVERDETRDKTRDETTPVRLPDRNITSKRHPTVSVALVRRHVEHLT